DDRDSLVAEATQKAIERFDELMRDLALQRYQAFVGELSGLLTRFTVAETIRRCRQAGDLHWPAGMDEATYVEQLADKLTPKYGPWLAKSPALEDVNRLAKDVSNELNKIGALDDPASALALKDSLPEQLFHQ